MRSTKIEWTEATWNPVTGCTKISEGCINCYAERMARRLQCMGQPNYRNGFQVTLQEKMLELPLNWRKPQHIFVNSMSDLFHQDVPTEFIMEVFGVMRNASWHRFQVLTKRPERMLSLSPKLEWPSNIWAGVTVESAQYAYRIDQLRQCGARTKFVSLEPLLTPLPNLDLECIDWVIVGGESGAGARPMEPSWAIDIRDQCVEAGVPFFFKQWGGFNKKKTGRTLDGKVWGQMPVLAYS